MSSERLTSAFTPRLNKYIKHMPYPKQAAFLLCNQQEILFGGAAGGGKSDALLMAALQYFDQPGYSALIVRMTSSSLNLAGGLIDRSKDWLGGKAHWNGKDQRWTSPEGGKLSFGHLADIHKYGSSEFQFIGFEEVCDVPDIDTYFGVLRRLRRNHELAHIPLRIRCTANPDGAGFDWVKERWVTSPNTSKSLFIPSTVLDNPAINAEEYLALLSNLGPVMYRKMALGDWDAVTAGEYFDSSKIAIGTPPPPHTFTRRLRFWDHAATMPSENNRDPDYLCSVRIGETQSGEVWIDDITLDRLGPDATHNLIIKTTQLDGKYVKPCMWQDPGSAGKSLIANFQRELHGYRFEGERITGNKEVSAGAVSAACHRNQLNVSNLIDTRTRKLFNDQLDKFPITGHDDAVDALSGAYNTLFKTRPPIRNPIGKRII